MFAHARDLFARFQNLNLLMLMQDLRQQWTTSGNWESGHLLCPIAHGMPDGATVERLKYMSQAVNLDKACVVAAGVLGTQGEAVRRFVDAWDAAPYAHWLLGMLEHIWNERVQDAEAAQRLLRPDPFPVLLDAPRPLATCC